MSETAPALNQRAEGICAILGMQGMTHIEVHRYRSNEQVVSSVTAIGDCGQGPVSVTAISEGRNSTYMMQGVDPEERGPIRTMGADLMRGVYRDLGHELLGLLDERPDEGGYDLPLMPPTALESQSTAGTHLPFAA